MIGDFKTMIAIAAKPPTRLAQSYQEPDIAKDPVLAALRKQAEASVPMPNVPEMTMVWTPAASAMNAVLHKLSTPKVALDEAQKAVQKDVAGLRRSGRPADPAPAKTP